MSGCPYGHDSLYNVTGLPRLWLRAFSSRAISSLVCASAVHGRQKKNAGTPKSHARQHDERQLMGMAEKMWDGIATVIKMNDKVERLAAAMVDQQHKLENLIERVIRLETALEFALV